MTSPLKILDPSMRSDGVGRMGKVRGVPSAGAPEFQAQKKLKNFPVTVKIRTSGYRTLERFIATPPT